MASDWASVDHEPGKPEPLSGAVWNCTCRVAEPPDVKAVATWQSSISWSVTVPPAAPGGGEFPAALMNGTLFTAVIRKLIKFDVVTAPAVTLMLATRTTNRQSRTERPQSHLKCVR